MLILHIAWALFEEKNLPHTLRQLKTARGTNDQISWNSSCAVYSVIIATLSYHNKIIKSENINGVR